MSGQPTKMGPFLFTLACCFSLVFLTINPGHAQNSPSDQGCDKIFHHVKSDFILDAKESINDGAAFVGNPDVQRPEDCVNACCQMHKCDVAMIEDGTEDGSIKKCFLFDCSYKQRYVCRFITKLGFSNYIQNPVFQHYRVGPVSDPGKEDKRPIANAGKDVVVQPQTPVTLNGTESWDDHGITIYQWQLLMGNSSVVMKNTDFKDQLMVSNLFPGVYQFQLTVTDSIGQSDAMQIQILVLSPEQTENYCLRPLKVGPCRAAFPRWHYNAATNSCEEFIYGGCKGNRNNYLTAMECSKACEGSSVHQHARRLDVQTEVCGDACKKGQFTCANGCCLEKGLECDDESQCSDNSDELNCERVSNTLSQLLEIEVNEDRARCIEPPKTGPCRAHMIRWYYNPLNRKCHQFTFGGCSGNDNNFFEEDVCMTTCEGVTEDEVFAKGLFERSEQDDTNSGSVALGVILGLAAFAALAVLGYCFLKRRTKRVQHAQSPVASATPTSPHMEETHHLVYNPTTTPTKP